MGGHRARQYWEHIGLMMLMGSLLLAPAAWFLDLQVSYAMVKWTCDEDRKALLLLVPAFSLGIVGIAGWMAWSSWLKLRNEAVPAGGRMEDRSYFLAIAGLGTSALFALLILSSLVPRIMLSPCE